MAKATLQEFADALVSPEFRQPLKSLDEALDAVGWERDVDRPTCCSDYVAVRAFIGSPYHAECKTCGRFIWNVTGPRFGNGHADLIDGNKVDTDTPKQWITGAARQSSALRGAG